MRTCLFCDNRADSKEDIWPRWILKGKPSRTVDTQRGKLATTTQTGPDANVRAKCVCKECNNTWMSDLEGAVQSILEPMFWGTSATLDVEKQILLSTWITKVAMVSEALRHKSSHFFLPDERKHLRRESFPPPTVVAAWLAHYSGASPISSTGTDLTALILESGIDFRGFAFTINVGAFVGQLIAIRYETDIAIPVLDVVDPGKRGIHIRPVILPAVDWPPPVSLDDGGNSLEEFSKRFAGHGPPP